ncbi:MAG TPA: hypothetical protein PJ982_09505, partial [Lacipirellulaceae bacterium]|nr:hypothetical protein [Lacipirellulaceae bacterium]
DAEPSQGAPYTYFAAQWFPGVTIDPRVQGHARHDVLWTAPASVNAGGIEIRGSIEQLFENPDPAPGRIQRLSVFKNGAAYPSFFVDSLQPVVDGVILNRVDFGPVLIPVVPGDTLRFLVDGSGAGGNGIVTFVAWNVQLHEAVPEPAAAGLAMASCVALLAAARRRR